MADLFRTPATYGFNAPEEVYPGYPGIVVREHEGARVLQSMNWGFPVRLKNMKPTSKPKPVNNARDDKLLTPFWKHWFTTPAHRCLIPFTSFAEAEGPKGKMTRTWISVADQPTAAWAGLWRPSDEWGDCYTGVMVDATEDLIDIHDRCEVCRCGISNSARPGVPLCLIRSPSKPSRDPMPIFMAAAAALGELLAFSVAAAKSVPLQGAP